MLSVRCWSAMTTRRFSPDPLADEEGSAMPSEHTRWAPDICPVVGAFSMPPTRYQTCGLWRLRCICRSTRQRQPRPRPGLRRMPAGRAAAAAEDPEAAPGHAAWDAAPQVGDEARVLLVDPPGRGSRLVERLARGRQPLDVADIAEAYQPFARGHVVVEPARRGGVAGEAVAGRAQPPERHPGLAEWD